MGHIGAFTLLGGNDAGRNPHRRGPGGHGLEHHRIGANFGAIAHLKAAQHLGPGGYHHVLPQRRMALRPFVERGAAQGHAVVNRAAIANHRRLANHHAHAVVNEHPLTNHRTGMNFNPRQPPPQVRSKPPQPFKPMLPAPMRRPVPPNGMQAGIAGDNFPDAARCRVALKNALDIGTQA